MKKIAEIVRKKGNLDTKIITDSKNKNNSIDLFEYSSDDYNDISAADNIDSYLICRQDIDLKFIELPEAITETEAEGYLKIKLRSIYPGNPENTAFDYRFFNTKTKKFAAVFIIQKEKLEEHKKITQGKPLMLPFTLLQKYFKKNIGSECLITFWTEKWIELFFLTADENNPVISIIIKRSGSITSNAERIKRILPENKIPQKLIHFTCSKEESAFKEYLNNGSFSFIKEPYNKDSVNNKLKTEICLIEDLLKKNAKEKSFVFGKKKVKITIPFFYRIQFYIFLIITAFFFLFIKSLDTEKTYYNKLNEFFGKHDIIISKVIAEENRLKELENNFAIYKDIKPVDLYAVLSEIYFILANNTEIESFLFDGNHFYIQATGPNPLEIMDKFENSNIFYDVKLPRITEDKQTGLSNFKISGKLNAQ